MTKDFPFKHGLSKTDPIAQHDFECDWCHQTIIKGRKHVRYVYESHEDQFFSKHYHVDCWEEMSKE